MTGIKKRSTNPGHGQSKLTRDMTDATKRNIKINQLDAEYDALVGGAEGRKKSSRDQSHRYENDKFRFQTRRKSR